MVWFCTGICLLLSIWCYYKDRTIYSARGMFAFFWALLMGLSGLRLYELYETSDFTYLIVTLGVILFSLGSFLASMIKIPPARRSDVINPYVYNFLCVICLIGLIYNIQILMRFVTSGFNISAIYYEVARTASGEVTDLTGLLPSWQEQLRQYVGYPLLYTIVPISISAYISTRRLKYLIVSIVFFALRFLVDIRRTFLVMLILLVIVRLLMERNKERSLLKDMQLRVSKRTLSIIGIGIVCLAFFIWLSSVRRGEGEEQYSFLQNFYFYYAGSLPYLSSLLGMTTITTYTMGLTAFRGLAAPIFSMLAPLGLGNADMMAIATDNISQLHNTVLMIAPGHRFNSYATAFYQFFQDGGIWGVAILSMIFGLYAHYLFKCMKVRQTERDKMKYAYFFAVFILFSMLHFNAAVLIYVWPLIFERFFYQKKDYSTNL